MKRFIQAAALAAFALASSAFTQQAHASFRIRIDNKADGAVLAWAATASNVQVHYQLFGSADWVQVAPARALSTIAQAHDFVYLNALVPIELVAKIRVTMAGSDMLFVDQVEAYGINALDGSEALVSRWGVDNITGWCLSTNTAMSSVNCSPANATASRTFIR